MPAEVRSSSLAFLATTLAGCLLAACSVRQPGTAGIPDKDYGPAEPVDVSHVPDAVPRVEPLSRYGNPPSYKVNGREYHVMHSSKDYRERGIASWYGLKFQGRRTSSWEPYDMYQMTAAHKSLPLPSYARVVNLQNGKEVVVRVNDRGPFHDQRIIDLSYAAASRIGVLEKGTGLVEVIAIDPTAPQAVETEAQAAITTENPDIYLQVGAFGSNANAVRQKHNLSLSLNLPIRIEDVEQDGRTVSRVQIGPLTDVEQLDDLVLKLGRIGISDTHVVIR